MSFIHSTSKKQALVLSYLAMLFNTLAAIFLTPLLLKLLGVDQYGLYQMIYSVGGYILVLDLGMATVMVRYISEYRAKKDKIGEQNFAGMMSVIVVIIATAMAIIGLIVDRNLEGIFQTLSTSEYSTSHTMFAIMIIQFVITVFSHFYSGIIQAYERFFLSRTINLVQIIIAFGLTLLLVKLGMGPVGIVLANLIVIILRFLINAYYVHFVLKFKIKLHKWNHFVMKTAFGLMIAILLQSLIGMVNQGADKTILGIMSTKTDVAIYSVSASILTLFNTIPSAISGMFQPQVVRLIIHGATKSQLTDLVIRVGRWQFILTGAMLAGFILFGNDFFTLWVGDKMNGALAITLIIMPFNMIPLIQTVCLSILNAYDKRLYRSLILIVVAVVNIILTVILVGYIGIYGAPVGTAISYFVGHGVLMNIYYSKKIKLEVGKMFKEIFSKTLPSLIITSLIVSPLILWVKVGIIPFTIKVSTFLLVYGAVLYAWGFNKEERGIVRSAVNRIV